MNHQDVFNIAEYCSIYGISDAVISPGSRNALLMLSFSRHPAITCHVIADERSAGFTALGIAQSKKRPVALVCTSGTAGVNYGPSVIEAFYTNTPLIVFTADRPPEWIDQLDGQTIRQNGLFAKHIKYETELPVSTEEEGLRTDFEEKLHSGLKSSMEFPQGPVHFNVPIREPFYTKTNWNHKKLVPLSNRINRKSAIPEALIKKIKSSKKVLIVPGQSLPNIELQSQLSRLSEYGNIAIVADHISNSAITSSHHHDLWLNYLDSEQKSALSPDVLITMGRSIISKSLKLYLREQAITEHWNINETLFNPDPFQSITNSIKCEATDVLSQMVGSPGIYQAQWSKLDEKAQSTISQYSGYSEFSCINRIMSDLEGFDTLHLSNSMSVRYANFFETPESVSVFSNRGASGIDGCTSTAMGHSISNDQSHLLITGDTAFFYDINALWRETLPKNLKIVILNNHGGGIFRIIPGPSDQPELERFFEARHRKTAKFAALEYGLSYSCIASLEDLEAKWSEFKASTGLGIMELMFDPEVSPKALIEIKERIKTAIS